MKRGQLEGVGASARTGERRRRRDVVRQRPGRGFGDDRDDQRREVAGHGLKRHERSQGLAGLADLNVAVDLAPGTLVGERTCDRGSQRRRRPRRSYFMRFPKPFTKRARFLNFAASTSKPVRFAGAWIAFELAGARRGRIIPLTRRRAVRSFRGLLLSFSRAIAGGLSQVNDDAVDFGENGARGGRGDAVGNLSRRCYSACLHFCAMKSNAFDGGR